MTKQTLVVKGGTVSPGAPIAEPLPGGSDFDAPAAQPDPPVAPVAASQHCMRAGAAAFLANIRARQGEPMPLLV